MWLTKLKTFAFVLVAAVAVGTGGLVTYRALGSEGKTDKEKLEGKWVIASAERGGKKVGADDDGVKGLTITIKGDKATLSQGGRTQEATVALDSGKTPKQIDLTVNEGGKDEVHLGIYKLDGDTFTLCKSHPPGERPTKFAGVEGQKWPAVFVLKREKK